ANKAVAVDTEPVLSGLDIFHGEFARSIGRSAVARGHRHHVGRHIGALQVEISFLQRFAGRGIENLALDRAKVLRSGAGGRWSCLTAGSSLVGNLAAAADLR